MTQFTTRAHLARATLESVCYQTKDIVQVMAREVGVHLESLRVDGGLTNSDVLAQLQADILGIPISNYRHYYFSMKNHDNNWMNCVPERPSMTETTALGAAMAAGNAEGVNVWSLDQLDLNVITMDSFTPKIAEEGFIKNSHVHAISNRLITELITWLDRDARYTRWLDAVKRTLGWETVGDESYDSAGKMWEFWEPCVVLFLICFGFDCLWLFPF